MHISKGEFVRISSAADGLSSQLTGLVERSMLGER